MSRDKDKLTSIQVECWKLLRPRLMGMMVLSDEDPGWVRTYSIEGWQRFPMGFIMEHGVSSDPNELKLLVNELKAKGYECTFCSIIEEEKEIYDGQMDAYSEI